MWAGLGWERDRSRRFRGRETRMVEELIGRFRELGYGATGGTSPGAARRPGGGLGREGGGRLGGFRELGYGATGATSPGASRLSEDVLEQTVEDVLLRAFGTEFSR